MRVGYPRRILEARALENRLAIAAGMWRESLDAPLPKLSPGEPAAQVQEFELRLVEALCAQATPENARRLAEKTWDLVHDRPDDDPVKRRVTECHEELARLSVPGAE
jgi:hypothetical protein